MDDKVREHLRESRAYMADKVEAEGGSRELALAITKVDEALLWFQEDVQKRRPTINEASSQ